MAIFSRRILQRFIDENSEFLSASQTKDLVNKLNKVHDISKRNRDITLSWEWEVALLNVFGKIGKIIYEKKFSGQTKGDIYFQSLTNPKQQFLIDITTASDKSLKNHNPVDLLFNQMCDVLSRRGLKPQHFYIEPKEEYYNNATSGTKIRLCLPGSSRFHETIFTKRFDEFMDSIIKSPKEEHI